MRRHAIGFFAVLLLAGAILLWLCPPVEGGWPMIESAFWRVGTVMAVLWLAYPDVQRMPVWLLGTVPLVILLIALRPRWAVYLIPLLLIIGILRSFKRR